MSVQVISDELAARLDNMTPETRAMRFGKVLQNLQTALNDEIAEGPMIYMGAWNALTNTPTLADGTGNNGNTYRVSVGGTQNLGSGALTFAADDRVIYNGTTWEKWDANDAVQSVFSRTGAVVAQAGDYSAFYDKLPVGSFINHGGRTAPSGYLACDRSSVLRATYQNLFDVRCEAIGTATMTIASPCVVSLTGHGLAIGDGFFFTTTGTLPTDVSANVQYFVITAGFGADSFQFSATVGGSAVNSSGSQSGVHTLRWCPDGIADSTHFNLPDGRGLVMVGAGAHGSMTRADGSAYNGGSVGATRNDQMQAWQLGADNDDAGARNYYARALARDNAVSQVSATDYTNIFMQTTTQGGANKVKAMDDGTNGTPRTGNETRPAETAVLVCIKY